MSTKLKRKRRRIPVPDDALVILVTGSRTYTNVSEIENQLAMLPEGAWIAHGCAPGADMIAERLVAGSEGYFSAYGIPADWTRFGKRAGIFRNIKLYEDCLPDGVLAFHDKETLEESRGTHDAVRRARKLGIPVRVFGRDTRLKDLVRWRREPFDPRGEADAREEEGNRDKPGVARSRRTRRDAPSTRHASRPNPREQGRGRRGSA